jgi:hypothetical protein
MNEINEKKTTSWGWIIFWLIVFWPVGLCLVIKKFATDKKSLMSGKITSLSTVGWILVAFGGLGFFGCVTKPDGAGGAVVALVIAAGGVPMIIKARKTKQQAEKYRQYLDIVVNNSEKSIDNIAGALAIPYEVVTKDLQDMINIGFLKNAYIHQGNREIVMQQVTSQVETPQYQSQTTTPTKPARCPGCGANNIVTVGRVCECDYCGTPINS